MAPVAEEDGSTAAGDRGPSPVALSLEAARLQREGVPPPPFCPELGRRLLLAQSGWSDWVLRRVERVRFQEDRNVVREVAVEFSVPEDAPVFTEDGEDCWLVPLALLWRRTLVEFQISDEDDHPMTQPGLRLTQQVDQSVLLAAAAAVGGDAAAADPGVRGFVCALVAGPRDVVERSWRAFDQRLTGLSAALRTLREDPAFYEVAERMRGSYGLYVFLPCSRGRHRLLRLRFVEPVTWAYQRPSLRREDDTGDRWSYDVGGRPRRLSSLGWILATLGFTATRIRIQVPAAEHAASYHLEVVAPPGVRIGEATLLAGPPGGAEREVTIDHLRGSALTVGLHGVDVPRRSLCRAQVHMRVQAAGWLTTTALTTLAIAAALLVLLLYGPGGEAKDVETTLVAGVAAAAATFIVQRDHGTLASRLVMLLRFSAFTATALLVVGVGLVALGGERDVRRMLLVFTVVATALFLHLAAVWFRSWRMDRRRGEPSPWDMVPGPQAPRPGWLRRWWCDLGEAYRQWRVVRRWDRHGLHPPSDHDDLARLVVAHRFDRPAVGIQSAEAWHRRFDRCGREADDRMRENLRRPATACGVLASGSPPCPRPRHRCPGALTGGATQNGHHAGPHPPGDQNS